jgi:hypothetical protein
MSIEAMKQAVATIDKIIDGCNNVQEEKDIHGDAKTLAKLIKKDCFPTLEALCQAIAEAEKQEPVAFRNTETGEFCTGGFLRKDLAKWQPLYAAPREWVGLTDEDIDLYGLDEGVTDNKAPAWLVTYARGIEAKLKEKNT